MRTGTRLSFGSTWGLVRSGDFDVTPVDLLKDLNRGRSSWNVLAPTLASERMPRAAHCPDDHLIDIDICRLRDHVVHRVRHRVGIQRDAIRVEELASMANMSPVQYQKRLRLTEARRIGWGIRACRSSVGSMRGCLGRRPCGM